MVAKNLEAFVEANRAIVARVNTCDGEIRTFMDCLVLMNGQTTMIYDDRGDKNIHLFRTKDIVEVVFSGERSAENTFLFAMKVCLSRQIQEESVIVHNLSASERRADK